MAENSTNHRKMDSQEAQRTIDALAGKYGLRQEESDIETYATKNAEDRSRYLSDLEAQYQRRSASDQPSSERSSGGSESGGNGGSGSSSSAQSSTRYVDAAFQASLDKQNKLMEQLWADSQARAAEERTREAERKAKADSLYNTYMGRASQALNLDPNDPIIKAQVDAYRAEQERARRGYISDVAEASGPIANIRGEERMAAERTGQAVSTFQAQLLGRELESRRNEIAEALSSMGSILSADQTAGLQRELAAIDAELNQLQTQTRATSDLGQLGLGYAGLDMDKLKMEMLNRQFYSGLESQEDIARANLGFEYDTTKPWWEAAR